MKRAFIVLFFLMSLFFKAHSEDIKRPNIYNVQRAIEALNIHIPEHTRSLSGSLLGYKTIP